MTLKKSEVRVQVVMEAIDRAEAEMLTDHYYGLSLAQFLRLVTKLIAQEKLDIEVVTRESGCEPKNPPVKEGFFIVNSS